MSTTRKMKTLKQNKIEITTEEIQEWRILNEYDKYREKEYSPISLEKFLIKKLIEAREELNLKKQEQ
jgi:hypothetical protein